MDLTQASYGGGWCSNPNSEIGQHGQYSSQYSSLLSLKTALLVHHVPIVTFSLSFSPLEARIPKPIPKVKIHYAFTKAHFISLTHQVLKVTLVVSEDVTGMSAMFEKQRKVGRCQGATLSHPPPKYRSGRKNDGFDQRVSCSQSSREQ